MWRSAARWFRSVAGKCPCSTRMELSSLICTRGRRLLCSTSRTCCSFGAMLLFFSYCFRTHLLSLYSPTLLLCTLLFASVAAVFALTLTLRPSCFRCAPSCPSLYLSRLPFFSEFSITGADRVKFLESLVVADLKSLPAGKAQLSVFTNEKVLPLAAQILSFFLNSLRTLV